MRMRARSNLEQRILNCHEKLNTAGFSFEGKELQIEIGCGKGNFIIETAKRNPDINFVAVEKVSNIIVLAMERAVKEEVKNIKFMAVDAGELVNLIPENSVSRIYLNFSDPWPKKQNMKRRLTYDDFLEIYKKLLTDDGEIHFKTDNKDLFEFSLGSFNNNAGYTLKNISYDLHNSDFKGNIMTEYEKIFSSEGKPIYRLEAKINR